MNRLIGVSATLKGSLGPSGLRGISENAEPGELGDPFCCLFAWLAILLLLLFGACGVACPVEAIVRLEICK